MKIVQCLASKGAGGLENVFIGLCNALSKKMEVEVIVFKDAACIQKLNKNIQVHELSSKSSRFNILLYIEFYKLMRNIKPDIVHTHAAKATQIFYYLNTFLKVSHVATKHNVRKGKIFNKVPQVIAVSKLVKTSIDNKSVQVIYNGVQPVLTKKQSQNKVFTMVSIGRLDKVKGFDSLINACSALDFPYHLQIVGEGKERESLENLIQKLGIENHVTLLGFKSNVQDYLNACHLQVISSTSEGFSLAMVEGIFYAPILLSTKVGVCVEILPDELLCDISDLTMRITNIYENQEEYLGYFNTIKQNYKEKLTIKVCAKEHLNVYQSVIIGDGMEI